jgi:hypothetical protein
MVEAPLSVDIRLVENSAHNNTPTSLPPSVRGDIEIVSTLAYTVVFSLGYSIKLAR